MQDGQAGAQRAPSNADAARRVRVLLVDDSATVRRMLRLVLAGTTGIEIVGEAPEAEQALELVKRLCPDLVVMDWQMPGMNGVDATRLIRQRHPEVSVVGFTSSGEPSVHERFLEAGASAVFAKEQALELGTYLKALAGSAPPL
jgi:two-component system, NarL family, response regulator DesR